jgi:arylsulfatase A-like enzyme
MADRPNILFITTDQQRSDTIHAAGNGHIFTPHLDWLCRQGIRYSRCYTDCPVCMAARATIMTGLHAITTGLTCNAGHVLPMADNPTLAGLLTRHGYQTRAIGKMHFHPLRAHYGFEHMELLHDYYRLAAKHPEWGVPMNHGLGQNEMQPAIATVDESHSLTHWTVERSIDFLETRDSTRPFFLWTSFAKPHPPFDPGRNYWELYRDIDMPLPVYGDWSHSPDNVPAGFREPSWSLNNVHTFTPAMLKAVKRAYYACITQIDYNLGLLFARLRELELLRNTWIIFTADHGEMLGDHYLGAKSIFLEGAAHIPLLIRPPGEWDDDPRRDTVSDALVCLADILPTCLNLAGVSYPADRTLDGCDVLGDQPRRTTLFGHCGAFHMVIDGPYKYQYSALGGAELLFNLEDDPQEQHNLLTTPKGATVAKRLRALLVAQLTEHQDPAVKDGKLTPTHPAPTARDVHCRMWPGFHSGIVPTDVLH